MNLLFAIGVLFFITCIPALELRASIPVGFFALDATCAKVAQVLGFAWEPCALNPWVVAGICIVANIVLGVAIFEVLLPCLQLMRRLDWFEKRIWPMFEKRREKLRPAVEKYGEWGLAIFIGVPLPGTGAVTGAVGAFLLGFDRKRFYLANAAGVLIAGICVTALCFLILNGAVAEDSLLRRLFIKEM